MGYLKDLRPWYQRHPVLAVALATAVTYILLTAALVLTNG